jgi:hypothetical protein
MKQFTRALMLISACLVVIDSLSVDEKPPPDYVADETGMITTKILTDGGCQNSGNRGCKNLQGSLVGRLIENLNLLPLRLGRHYLKKS